MRPTPGRCGAWALATCAAVAAATASPAAWIEARGAVAHLGADDGARCVRWEGWGTATAGPLRVVCVRWSGAEASGASPVPSAPAGSRRV